jgi:hypothetical protein
LQKDKDLYNIFFIFYLLYICQEDTDTKIMDMVLVILVVDQLIAQQSEPLGQSLGCLAYSSLDSSIVVEMEDDMIITRKIRPNLDGFSYEWRP